MGFNSFPVTVYKAIYTPKCISDIQPQALQCNLGWDDWVYHPPCPKGGEFHLKKETIEYLRGERNVTKDEFIIGRERTGNSEFVIVSLPESEKPLYALWNSRKVAKGYRKLEDSGEIIFERVTAKGTGGKESYVMLMPYAISELNKKSISLEAAGVILKLADCIEWNTGRICRRRDSRSMTREMLLKTLGIGNMKLKSILRELKKLDVLFYDEKKQAYFVNRKYIRKGAAFDED